MIHCFYSPIGPVLFSSVSFSNYIDSESLVVLLCLVAYVRVDEIFTFPVYHALLYVIFPSHALLHLC